jgi:hypothetical protein
MAGSSPAMTMEENQNLAAGKGAQLLYLRKKPSSVTTAQDLSAQALHA